MQSGLKMQNKNSILKLNKNTIKRYEHNLNNGVLFLFNAVTKKHWAGNSASYEILKLVNGKRTLSEIYEDAKKIFDNLSNEEIEESINSILTEWIYEKFINITEPHSIENNTAEEWLGRDLEECIETCMDFHFHPPRKEALPLDEFKKLHVNATGANLQRHERYYFERPLSMKLIVESNCNLRCKHCYFFSKPEIYNSENNTPKEKIFETVDIMADKFSCYYMTIAGGEPFLRNDILEILEYIKSKNIALYIQTNGTLLTDEIIDKLEKILNFNTDIVQISIDGLSPASHETIRGKDVFSKSINVLTELTKKGFTTAVNCTALSENVLELPKIYEFLRDLKVKKISFGKFDLKSDKQSYLIPDEDILFKAASEIIRLNKEDDFQGLNLSLFENLELINNKKTVKYVDKYINESNDIFPHEDLGCAYHSGFCINSEGSVHLCPEVYATCKEFIMGNIKNDSLVDIWEKRHENLFFQPRMKDNMICKNCKYVYLCRGGCPAKAYAKYGDKHMPDPECRIGAEIIKNSNSQKTNE